MSSEQKAQELISIFSCRNDIDIENFLKEKAILFEKLGKSRTFIIYNEEEFSILAYFTLSIQVLKIPQNLSNRKIMSLDGYSAKINGEKITEIPAILIGQLAKNDLHKNDISGIELMNYCLSTVLDGQMRLGGRIIMLECYNKPYLVDFYKKFGFVKLEKDYSDKELFQFYRILQEDDLIEK